MHQNMSKYLFFGFLILTTVANGQKFLKYDSTLKIGKVGYRVFCMNRSVEKNAISIRPIGFKSEGRDITLDLKGKVAASEIEDLNNDGFPDLVVYVTEKSGNANLFSIASKENETIEPIILPDITNDMQMSKGYRGGDEYKLVEGILFRKFPVYESDTTIKTPTNKIRQILYRVVRGEQPGIWKYKPFKNFDLSSEK
jgi:hypothetical protein